MNQNSNESKFLRQKYGLDDCYQVMWGGRDISKSPDDIEVLAANMISADIDIDDLANQIQTVNAPPNHLIYILFDNTNERPPILGLLSSDEQKAISQATIAS